MEFAYALLVISSAFIFIIIIRLINSLRKFNINKLASPPEMLEELPSVSICIPARNERHAMTACLERVLASTYPKIEIIVLDDESSDNTSVLIKSFAHAGVRFVEGSPLPEGWLGKNHALNSLLSEASGTYLIFMDVDTLVDPETIGQLVAYAESEKSKAVSVLPVRDDGYRVSAIFGTLRYFWEIIAHSSTRPAASGGVWMINRKSFMQDFSGFDRLKNQIQPESIVAKHYSETDEYRFLISSKSIGLSYEKKWQSQVDTSIRLLYPFSGASLIGVLLLATLLLILAYPGLALFIGVFTADWLLSLTAFLAYTLSCVMYGIYLYRVRTRGWLLGSLVWPYVAVQELIVLLSSYFQYKTDKVSWKGRPIRSSVGLGRR